MAGRNHLYSPGPTNVPQSVLNAMNVAMEDHRSPAFPKLLKPLLADLKKVFKTEAGQAFIFPATGTAGWEVAFTNTLNPGDKVLIYRFGQFGHLWAAMGKRLGLDVEVHEVPWGKGIPLDHLEARLKEDASHEIKAVLATHNETSTGVTNDLKTLNDIIQEHGAISVVDGVTSVGAIPLKMDEWKIDVVVSGSQKGFMIPPGLAFLACSKKAWKAYEDCKNPSFYFNFGAYKKSAAENTTPYTPNVSLIMALRETLKMMKAEGLENIFNRHAKLAAGLRAGVRSMGLQLFVEDDSIASNAITSILPPDGITVPDIRKTLNKDFDIVVANGQNQLQDKIFRMGHLGFVSERDLITAIGSLEMALAKLGHKSPKGEATTAAIKALI
ncbi:MAG: alanine--glyoxylate aminotransferase family protein [Chlorobiales bacterium]|nr:alanine--glyoxylate aminotransferase family protein [Chlorobiales bacterium]